MEKEKERKIEIIGGLCKKHNKDVPLGDLKNCIEKKICLFGKLEECSKDNFAPFIKIKIKCV